MLSAMDSLLDHWWVAVTRGLLTIAFGILVVAIPHITPIVMLMLFAAFVLLDGIVSLSSAMGNRGWGWQLFGGLVSIAIGVVTFQRPTSTGLVLVVVIALWAIARGLTDIADVVTFRSELAERCQGLSILSGVVSILFGFFVAIWPLLGALTIADLVAPFSAVLGSTLLVAGFRERSLHQAYLVSPAAQIPIA